MVESTGLGQANTSAISPFLHSLDFVHRRRGRGERPLTPCGSPGLRAVAGHHVRPDGRGQPRFSRSRGRAGKGGRGGWARMGEGPLLLEPVQRDGALLDVSGRCGDGGALLQPYGADGGGGMPSSTVGSSWRGVACLRPHRGGELVPLPPLHGDCFSEGAGGRPAVPPPALDDPGDESRWPTRVPFRGSGREWSAVGGSRLLLLHAPRSGGGTCPGRTSAGSGADRTGGG